MATSKIASDASGEHGTYLNSSSQIVGNIVLQESARIDGKLQGDIVAQGEIIIGDGAIVSARIQAPAVVVCGEVSGDINAQSIEIGPRAKVAGNLTSAILNVEHGAVLEGRCSISGVQAEGEDPSRRELQRNPVKEKVSSSEPYPQHGVAPIRRQQRADLRARGYSDELIDKMTPIEVLTILGLS